MSAPDGRGIVEAAALACVRAVDDAFDRSERLRVGAALLPQERVATIARIVAAHMTAYADAALSARDAQHAEAVAGLTAKVDKETTASVFRALKVTIRALANEMGVTVAEDTLYPCIMLGSLVRAMSAERDALAERVKATEEALHIALAFAREYDAEHPDDVDRLAAEWRAAWEEMARLVPSLRVDAERIRAKLAALLATPKEETT